MSIPSSGSSTPRSASSTSSRVGIGLRVSRQAILREHVPRSPGIHERVVLRPDLRVAVERAQPNRDLVAVRPVAAEETGAADRAKDLDRSALGRGVHTQQLLAGKQAEPLTRDPALREAEGARMLATAGAVAVVRAPERRLDLEADAAAETAALDRHLNPSSRTSSRRSLAKKWIPSTKRTQLQR